MRVFEQDVLDRLDNIQSALTLIQCSLIKKTKSNQKEFDSTKYDAIQNRWNAFCDTYKHVGLMKVKTMTEGKKRGVRKRLENKDFDFEKILKIIPLSSHLFGKNGWRVNFNFIFNNDERWNEIMEGQYVDEHNKRKYYTMLDHVEPNESAPIDAKLQDVIHKIQNIGKSF